MAIDFDKIINLGGFREEAKKTETSIDELNGSVQELTQTLLGFMKAQEQAAKEGLKGLQADLQKTETTTKKGQEAIVRYTQSIDEMGKQLERTKQAQKDVKTVSDQTRGSINEIRENLKRQVNEWNNLSKAERENTQVGGKLIQSIRKTRTELNDLNASTRKTNTAFSAAKGSYNALTQENKKLGEQLRQIPLEMLKTDKAAQGLQTRFRQNTERLKAFDAAMGQNFRNVGNYQNAIKGAITQLTGFGLGIAGVIEISRRFVQNSAEISDALADVRKTTDLTDEQVQKLLKTIKGFDTRTSIVDLLGIAQAGGRLNVAEEELAGFVQSVDKLFVALGDDLGGSSDEIATQLGKIAAVLGVEEEFGIAEGIERIGSAINDLAANSKASAGPIVDITTRLQGIAATTDISVTDIIGLAGTLDILGQRSESASTAVQKLFTNIGKDIPKFAGIAGKSVEEFSEIVRTDANEAFVQVLEGARSSEKGFLALTETLEALGINTQQAGAVLTALTQKTDILRASQERVFKAFGDNISITQEADIKNKTLGASLDKLGKAFGNLATGTGVVADGMKAVVDVLTLVINALGDLDLEDFIGGMASATAITGNFTNRLLEFLGVGESTRETISDIIDVIEKIINPLKLATSLWEKFNGSTEVLEASGKTVDLFGGKVLDTFEKVNADIAMYNERINNAAENGEQGLIPFFRSQIVELGKLQKELQKASDATKTITDDDKDQVKTLGTLKEELKALKEAREKINIEDQAALDKNAALIAGLEKQIEALEGNKKALKKAADEAKKLAEAREAGIAKFEEELYFYQLAEKQQKDLAVSTEELAKKYDDLTKSILTTNEAISKQKSDYEKTRSEVINLTDAFGIQDEVIDAQTEKDIKKQKERLERRKETEKGLIEVTFNALEQLSQLREQDFSRQFDQLESAKQYELSLVGDNEAAKAKIEADFAKKRKDLELQQAKAQKTQALFQVAIDTALGIAKTIADLGFPAAIPFVITAAAAGATQAAIIAATPLPKFKEGVIGLQGPGTETSDSIPAMLSRNESIMTGAETRAYKPTLLAIRKGTVAPELLNKVATGDDLPDLMRKSYISGYESLMNFNRPSITAGDIKQMIEVELNSKTLIKGIGKEVSRAVRAQKRPVNNISLEREAKWK